MCMPNQPGTASGELDDAPELADLMRTQLVEEDPYMTQLFKLFAPSFDGS